MKKLQVELWVACQLHGTHRGEANNPDNQLPVGTFEADNWIATKPAYNSKKGVYGAARYCHFDKPTYEDDDVIIYKSVGHYSKQDEYAMFIRKSFDIKVDGIKGIPSALKEIKK